MPIEHITGEEISSNEPEKVQYPNDIYAVGGAGAKLVSTVLNKKWILEHILQPSYVENVLNVVFMDTAKGEKNSMISDIKKINSKIQEIEADIRNTPISKGMKPGRINLSYILLTEEMVLESPHDLISIGDKVKSCTPVETWWVEDIAKGIDSIKIITKENFKDENFEKGVYRKRYMSKAIFYKALTEKFFNIGSASSSVDIVFGLGGGTGAGMAIDLAEQIKDKRPTAGITVFAVLTTLREEPDERANCGSTLTDIECKHLRESTLFKDIIIIPMEATKYSGASHHRDDNEENDIMLKEFDESFSYIFIAYHSNPQMATSKVPIYAPFTIATSQIIRYNVESTKEHKRLVDESLKSKKQSLESEGKMYQHITEFINKHFVK